MIQKKYNVIGVMSGTSLDGIDLGHIFFENVNGQWLFEIMESQTVSYTEEWVAILKTAINYDLEELNELNKKYTQLLGNIVKNFIETNCLQNIDAVCSHGHTILHQPQLGYTLQIGNLPQIAQFVQQNVVCDFRVQDVKLGGQGAPLVPVGDRILFPQYDYCLNLGGFSNISFEENHTRIAFDICPVNTVLNFYVNQLGKPFDDKGMVARSGSFNQDLFELLNNIPFYDMVYPKSLGFEFVKDEIFTVIDTFNISIEDILRTFVEHIAFQISKVIFNKNANILITGGGAYNEFLIDRIRFYLPHAKINIPNAKIIEFKEALIFALLGVLKLRNENNVLSSVTGASQDHSSGNIFWFDKL